MSYEEIKELDLLVTASELSQPMIQTLKNLRDGKPAANHCEGRSMFGGHTRVMFALARRRLVHQGKITDKGRKVLALVTGRA